MTVHHELADGHRDADGKDAAGGADAVIDAFRALVANDDGHLTVRVRVARAARAAAPARGVSRSDIHRRRDPLTDAQRTVVDRAHTHGLPGALIATVLRLDIGDVRRLANEGRGPFPDAIAIHPSSRQDRTGGLASTLASEP